MNQKKHRSAAGPKKRQRSNMQKALALVRRRIVTAAAPPCDVVNSLWPKVRPTLATKDLDLLAREGFRNRINDEMHYDRSADGQRGVRVQVLCRGLASDPPFSVLVSVAYVMEDGGVKELLRFTADDCSYIANQSREQAAGLLAVASYMDAMREKLVQHKASTVAALPKPVQAELVEKWPG